MYSEKAYTNEVIYIHPSTSIFEPLTLPLSLPALINRIPLKIKGYSASEIRSDVIKSAKIVIIDIHWYISLPGAIKLIKKIRSLNPIIKIIAGGITASEYAKLLVKQFGIDYIIRGDGELPLSALVNALLNDLSINSIPNIVGKDGLETGWGYILTKEDLDNNEFYNIDFFPTLKRRIKILHMVNKGWPAEAYPYIVPFRGCPSECRLCAGGKEEQKKLFRRGAIIRSHERLLDDFNRLNSDPDIHSVSVLNDFITLLPENYTRPVLSKYFNLYIHYEFASVPTCGMLDLLLTRFRGGSIYFSIDKKHATSSELNDIDLLVRSINKVKKTKNFHPILCFNSLFVVSDRNYLRAIKNIYRCTKVLLLDASLWWTDFPLPDIDGYANSADFVKFLHFKKTIKYSKIAATIFLKKLINAFDYAMPVYITVELRKSYYRLFHTLPFLIKTIYNIR